MSMKRAKAPASAGGVDLELTEAASPGIPDRCASSFRFLNQVEVDDYRPRTCGASRPSVFATGATRRASGVIVPRIDLFPATGNHSAPPQLAAPQRLVDPFIQLPLSHRRVTPEEKWREFRRFRA